MPHAAGKSPPRDAHVPRLSCAVLARAASPHQGLEAPCSFSRAGQCSHFGLGRGGGQWADNPGPNSDPKVWATRGVPHYGVHPLLSTLVGPFFGPGMPAHGVPSLGGGLHASTWCPAEHQNGCTVRNAIGLMLGASAANPKLLFQTCPRPTLDKSNGANMKQVFAPPVVPECAACGVALAEGPRCKLRDHTIRNATQAPPPLHR